MVVCVGDEKVTRAVACHATRLVKPRGSSSSVGAAIVEPRARKGGDDAGGNDDLSYRAVVFVGDKEVTRAVAGQTCWTVESRYGSDTVGLPPATTAREGDDTARDNVDLSYRVADCVGDEEAARTVARQT